MALPRFLAHLIRRLLRPAPVETQRYKDPCRSIWKNYTRAYDAPIPRDVPCNHHLAQGVKVQHMHPLAPIIQLRVAFVWDCLPAVTSFVSWGVIMWCNISCHMHLVFRPKSRSTTSDPKPNTAGHFYFKDDEGKIHSFTLYIILFYCSIYLFLCEMFWKDKLTLK